jgi:hypothetical protein
MSVRFFTASLIAVVCLAGREARADESDLAFRLRTEISGYKDSDATNVLTPGVRAEVDGVTDGWAVGASLLVDVVTSASADIVATASPRWTDTRYVPGLDGRFKVGDVTLSAAAGGSVESDYFAGSGTIGMAVDLSNKTVTPAFSYGFGYDIGGRRDTPLDVYALELMRHSFATNITFVINKSTIFVPGFAAVYELGDQEKPYRYLPTFSAGTEIEAGASREDVDLARTSVRLAENTPDVRQRYSLSGLLAHRFGSATLRLEERLYVDDWLLMASTTDSTIPVDISSSFRLWPHFRFHAQKGVSFWEAAYIVEENAQGVVAPQLRAGDRELGPMIAATAGMGFRVGSDHVGFTVAADAIYTRFLDHLFIQDRIAGFAAMVLDVEVD